MFVPASARSVSTAAGGAHFDNTLPTAEEVRRQRQGGAAGLETFLDLGELDRDAEEVSEWLERQQLERSDSGRQHDWDEIPVLSIMVCNFLTASQLRAALFVNYFSYILRSA